MHNSSAILILVITVEPLLIKDNSEYRTPHCKDTFLSHFDTLLRYMTLQQRTLKGHVCWSQWCPLCRGLFHCTTF